MKQSPVFDRPLVSASAVDHHYLVLNEIGCLGPTPEHGFLRAGYSDEETAAMRHFENYAAGLGAKNRYDELGNLTAEFAGSSGRFIEVGSHVDTVPFGGNYDGAAGIIAGILAIERVLGATAQPFTHGMRLRIWRNEESSTFNSLYTGSLGALGLLHQKSLGQSLPRQTLADAMQSQGVDPEFIRAGKKSIAQAELDSILGHFELHIEQGNLLEVREADIGVVTSIRGPWRARLELTGAFDHSGATPMGIEHRRDANLALGYFMVELDQLGKAAQAAGNDLVQTIGVINADQEFNSSRPGVYQNAVPKISGYCYCTLDIRSSDNSFKTYYAGQIKALAADIARRFGVQAELTVLSDAAAIEQLDQSLGNRLGQAAEALKYPWCMLPSGAGHDAANLAKQRRSDGALVPVAMVFIPCKNGKSHCPEEFASSDAIAKGANVLSEVFAELVR